MLSTLSSFLPSSLSDRLDRLDLRSDAANNQQQQTEVQAVKRRDMADVSEDSYRKPKKKKVSSNETFIVVRPPPAKSNHPLNLQLQLVPAHPSRDRPSTSSSTTPTLGNSRFSIDLGANDSARAPPSPPTTDSEHGLRRTLSIRSNRSDTSAFYASSMGASGSVTSFASTASTASGRRMIIPLYNLSAHNVRANTILDAGTDARVARFHKRGLELVDLAMLEPTEVWSGKENTYGAGAGSLGPLGVPIRRSYSGNSSLTPLGPNGSRPCTSDTSQSPGSSGLSVVSDPSCPAPYHPSGDFASSPAATPTGPKKLFGKLFRKKEGSLNGGQPLPSISVATVTASLPQAAAALPEPRWIPPKQSTSEVLLPAVLGLSPTLSGSTNPPTGRCFSYVWVVSRWLKVDNQGLISGVLDKIGREASAHGIRNVSYPDGGDWQVRFEWVRGKSKTKARTPRGRTSSSVGASHRSRTPNRRHSALPGGDKDESLLKHEGLMVDSPQQSLDIKRPVSYAKSDSHTPSPRNRASETSVTPPSHSDEDGDESDGEDSETPWTCWMILTHISAYNFTQDHSRTRTVSTSDVAECPASPPPERLRAPVSDIGHASAGPATIKLKVATLSPAPHHPKVVCQLKIPFPLPDADISYGMLRKRLVLSDGSTQSTIPENRRPGMPSLTVTAEEIKDVVCSTAFWLVVREGLGGVGKKTRKGDGWKIRG